MKVIWALISLTVLAFMLPIMKDWFDVFTAPATGTMITSGVVDETVLAVVTSMPWLIPLIIVVGLVLWIIRPEEPKSQAYPSYRMPNLPPQQRKKQKPPMI